MGVVGVVGDWKSTVPSLCDHPWACSTSVMDQSRLGVRTEGGLPSVVDVLIQTYRCHGELNNYNCLEDSHRWTRCRRGREGEEGQGETYPVAPMEWGILVSVGRRGTSPVFYTCAK